MTRFAGYAAIFDVPDEGGDVVRKGAFARSLAKAEAIPLLLQHRSGEVVGAIETIGEDKRGLRVIGRLAETRGGRAVAKLLASGLDGLSFGYRVRRSGRSGGLRTLDEVDLVEVSLVRQPMHPAARVHAVED